MSSVNNSAHVLLKLYVRNGKIALYDSNPIRVKKIYKIHGFFFHESCWPLLLQVIGVTATATSLAATEKYKKTVQTQ